MADGVELAKAYLTLVPTMRGMSGAIKSELGKLDGSSAGRKLGADMTDGAAKGFSIDGMTSKLGGLAVAATAAAATAATAAAVAFGKASYEQYASYEQLVGGVETLFKDSAGIVQGYAAEAYKTAGLSANQYMETVTSFSASLLQSLDGDTGKAATYADMAIKDMSDNANKMGTDMAMIQNAYQGFAKQNYTMLDNLKLGYGGTKTEMERLLADAQAISGIEFNIDSYADVIDAIHVIQTEIGITGTTALEASTTLEGSLNSAKAAYQNFLTGLMDENADIGKLTGNLVDTVSTFVDNLMPRIETFAENISEALPAILPKLVQVGVQLVGAIVSGIIKSIPALIEAMLKGITEMLNEFAENTDECIEAAGEFFMGIGTALAECLPELLIALGKALVSLIGTIITHIPDMLMAAGEFFMTLVTGLASAVEGLFTAMGEAIGGLFNMLGDAVGGMFQAGADLMLGLIQGIVSMAERLAFELTRNIATPILGIMSLVSPDAAAALEKYQNSSSFGELMTFAEGGYVSGPTLAMVGDGGHGEYMVPGNYIGQLAKEISSYGAAGGPSMTIIVQAGDSDDPEEMGRRIGAAAAYELRMQGVCA